MRIAVTGIGIVSALGVGKQANQENLLAGNSGVAAPQILNTLHKEWPVGEVKLTNEQLRQLLEIPSVTPEINRNVLLGTLAAREALQDASLSNEQVRQLMLVNGTTVGGMDLTENSVDRWFQGDYSDINAICQHEAGSTAEMISTFIGTAQNSVTISTACSSALNAIIFAANQMRQGQVKRVLAGGVEALTRFHLNGFGSLGILSEKICRPFHEDRDGINLGEGAAYLLLEDENEALNRGAHIYGYIAGYANRCDAFHQTASSPDGEGAFLSMQDALRLAGLQPCDIQYINAHGTATPNNDASEAQAIERLFGTPFQSPRWQEPRSTKNLTGHTTSASGSIEAVFCLMLMRARGYQYVLTNAFGFGGNDSSLVLSCKPADLPLPGDSMDGKNTPNENHRGNKAISTTSIYSVEEDADTKPYLTPMQARRMSPQMRRLIVAAKRALSEANIDIPDAIIVSTRWGGITPTVSLLKSMIENGEEGFSPSLFMQSTHNTPASTLAILLGCHGYNCTFSCGNHSAQMAQTDAYLQLAGTDIKNVLLCEYEEEQEDWQKLLRTTKIDNIKTAKALVLSCN